MSKKDLTLLEAKEGAEQLSDNAIRERLRPGAINAIKRILELQNSRNDAVALGASKYTLDKFVATLSSADITSGGQSFKVIIERYGEHQGQLTAEAGDSVRPKS